MWMSLGFSTSGVCLMWKLLPPQENLCYLGCKTSFVRVHALCVWRKNYPTVPMWRKMTPFRLMSNEKGNIARIANVVSVTHDCKVTEIVPNPGFQQWEVQSVSQWSQVCRIMFKLSNCQTWQHLSDCQKFNVLRVYGGREGGGGWSFQSWSNEKLGRSKFPMSRWRWWKLLESECNLHHLLWKVRQGDGHLHRWVQE